jgi:RNA-binding protein
MLTSKQKRYLKSLAHHLNATFQVGKDGVNSNMITDVLNYLNKHELMKVSILQNCPMDKDEVANEFENADIEVVQVIGKTIILYKHSENAKDPIKL